MNINYVYEDHEYDDYITLDNTNHYLIGAGRINSRSYRDFKCAAFIDILCCINKGAPITIDFAYQIVFRYVKKLFGYKCVNDKKEKDQSYPRNTVHHLTEEEFFKGKLPDGIEVSSVICNSKDFDPQKLAKDSNRDIYIFNSKDIYSLSVSKEYSSKAYEELGARMNAHRDTINKIAAEIVNLSKDGTDLEIDLSYPNDGLSFYCSAPHGNIKRKIEFASFGMSEIPAKLGIRFAFMSELCMSISRIKEITDCKVIIKPQIEYDGKDNGGQIRIKGSFGAAKRDLKAW